MKKSLKEQIDELRAKQGLEPEVQADAAPVTESAPVEQTTGEASGEQSDTDSSPEQEKKKGKDGRKKGA